MLVAAIAVVGVWLVVIGVAVARRAERKRGGFAGASSNPWPWIGKVVLLSAGLFVMLWPREPTHDNEAWGDGLDMLARLILGGLVVAIALLWFVLATSRKSAR